MLNCKEYECDFSFSVATVPNLLTEARDVGRKLRHSPDLKVSDAKLAHYFTTLTALLSDPQYLAVDTSAQEALQKLHKLNADNLYISTEDVKGVLQEAKVVIETGRLQLERTVMDGMNEILNQTKQSVSEVVEDSKLCQREIYRRTNEGLQALDRAVEEAAGKIQTVTLSSSAEQEEDLRRRLAKCYLKSLFSASISPIVYERDEMLEKFYVPPKVVERSKKIKNTGEEKESIPVECYRQVLCKDDKFVGRVFLVSEAGMGKSTFTAKIALDWSRKRTLLNKERRPSKHFKSKLFQDVKTLEDIDFLFHITLRDADKLCSLIQMIRDQLINRLYEPDETMEGFKILKNVLSNRRCVIVADGLDEWTHPFGIDCSCKEKDKVVPFLSPNIDATVLITTRPWRMAQHPVSDSAIDKLLCIEGVADTNQLVQNVLQCLGEESDEVSSLQRFTSYVETKNMVSLMSIPIIVMMLVCLWFQGDEQSFSLCDIYANMVAMMLKKTTCVDKIFMGDGIRLPRCFREARQFSNILVKLGQFAFGRLYASDRRKSLVFRDVEELTREELIYLLKTGVIRETKAHSLIKNTSSFSFIHKTVQEFLAALHLSIHPDAFDSVVKPYYDTNQDITDFEKVFIFVCGMNCDVAHRLSELLCDNLACTSYEEHNLYNYQVDIPSIDGVTELQNIIAAGHQESCNNGMKSISLALYYFRFVTDVKHVSSLKTLLSMNKCKVRYIAVVGWGEFINEAKLQEIFLLSSKSLIKVEMWQCMGRYDLSDCTRLKYLHFLGTVTSDYIKFNTESLVKCDLNEAPPKVQKEFLQSLRNGSRQLKYLHLYFLHHIVSFLQTLPLLTKLEYLQIQDVDFGDFPLLLPDSVTHIELSLVTMTATAFQGLVDWMESINHTVECRLVACSVEDISEFEKVKKFIRSSRNFMTIADPFKMSTVFRFCSVKN